MLGEERSCSLLHSSPLPAEQEQRLHSQAPQYLAKSFAAAADRYREVCRGWKIWVAIEVLSYAFSLFPGLFHSFFLFRKDLTEQGCSGGNLFFSRETHCDSHSHLIISQCNTSVCFLLALTPFYESHHLGALSLFLLPHFRLRKLHHINLISWGSSVSADLL